MQERKHRRRKEKARERKLETHRRSRRINNHPHPSASMSVLSRLRNDLLIRLMFHPNLDLLRLPPRLLILPVRCSIAVVERISTSSHSRSRSSLASFGRGSRLGFGLLLSFFVRVDFVSSSARNKEEKGERSVRARDFPSFLSSFPSSETGLEEEQRKLT